MQQQEAAQQDPKPWAPVFIMLAVVILNTLAIAAVVGDGYVEVTSIPVQKIVMPFTLKLGLYSSILKELASELLDTLPMLNAARAFGVISLASFFLALVSSVFDFRAGAVTVRTGALLVVVALLLLITGAALAGMYRAKHSEASFALSDISHLSWGFKLIFASSGLTFVLGVAMCVSRCFKGKRLPYLQVHHQPAPAQQQDYGTVQQSQ